MIIIQCGPERPDRILGYRADPGQYGSGIATHILIFVLKSLDQKRYGVFGRRIKYAQRAGRGHTHVLIVIL